MKAILFFLLFITAVSAVAQSEVSDRLMSDFTRYQSQNLQEKLFVHTDKSFYTAGEILWFKVYDMDAAMHKPITLSKVSYIEIISKDNTPVLQAKISMKDGNGQGSFQLPFSLTSGYYILKAYSNRMKNFASEFYFEKPITIVNTLKSEEAETIADTISYDIQFFPEGGNLVNGLESTVAFKGINQYGKSISFSGCLVNQKNDTLVRFQSYKFGMGKFRFTPSANDVYKAVIKINNKLLIKPLPKMYEQGYVMRLSSSDNNQLLVFVKTNLSSPEPYVYLFVHSQQSVQSVQVKQLSNNQAEFVVDKTALGDGISHFTIFNGARQPLCERLYFKQPKQNLGISIMADRPVYNVRKKIQLQVTTNNVSNQPIPANLSLSVFRLDSLQKEETTNIFSYVWLQSEIRGNIENLDYYLNDSSTDAREALDNLLLTQGWRRFQWEDVWQDKQPAFRFLPEYEGQIITGIITSSATGLPARHIQAYLSVPGEKFQVSSAESNDSGIIKWTVNHFYGAGEIVVQTEDTTQQYHIAIDDPFVSTDSNDYIEPLTLPEQWKNQLLEKSIAVQAQNIYLPDEHRHFMLSNESDTNVFYGLPDKRYLLDDYTRFPTMEEVMREYVTEVRLSKQGSNYHYTVDNLPYKVFFKDNPLVLLDGVPVWNINKIVAFNPLQVKQLDVVTHKYYLGSQTYDGIVSYTTYKGDVGGLELNPGSVQLEYEGLQLERQFYSPVYETPQQTESRLPDFRNLLYWSPDVSTNSDGRQSVTFYSSDLPGNYAVMVQGNTAEGLIGSKLIYISVNK